MTFQIEALDKDVVKRRTPLAAVCSALGIKLDTDGRGLCPFHEIDGGHHKPSFGLSVGEYGDQMWGCYPCDLYGDTYALVQRVRLCSFMDAVRFVAAVGQTTRPLEAAPERARLDTEGLTALVNASQRRALETESLGLLCVAAGLRDENVTAAERLIVDQHLRELGWGVDEHANVVMPHYKPSLELSGAKVRAIDGRRWSYPGSEYTHLYGCWRPNRGGWRDCLLVEGESDFAHAVISEAPAYPLSVPHGASKPREAWLVALSRYDRVWLALDSDEAGRAATKKWQVALATIGVDTKTLPIPDGEDLRSCRKPIVSLMEVAR